MLAGAAVGAGIAESRSVLADDPKALEQMPSAEQALQRLLDGNDRFVRGESQHPHMTEDWLSRLSAGQMPIATILACSDSRVPLELLFDQGFGDLFTIRIAGNVVTRFGIGSMEYAQHHLRTPLYIVLGHEGCGAVTAALLHEEDRAREPKGVRELLDLIDTGEVDPAASPDTQLAAAVEANVRNSTRQLMELDPDEEGFEIQENHLLVSAVYEISTGRVRVLDKLVVSEHSRIDSDGQRDCVSTLNPDEH